MSGSRNIPLKFVALPVKFLIAATLLAIAVPCPAQDLPVPVPPHRQKIALVLEGGGALGLAHVGVIEWLEENHVPVDAIAGTSMAGWWAACMPWATARKKSTIPWPPWTGTPCFATVFNIGI